MALQWYVVHVYSGFEDKVRRSLEERIAVSGCSEKFGRIVLPTEQVVELVKGKKKQFMKLIYSMDFGHQRNIMDFKIHLNMMKKKLYWINTRL